MNKSRNKAVTFDEIAVWARDDGNLLRREMLTALRQVIGQAGVKMRIAGVLMARNQLMRLQQLSELLDGDAGLTRRVFDPKRLEFMDNADLTRLWTAASKLRAATETKFIQAVLDPEMRAGPNPEDLKEALRTEELIDAETTELERRGAGKLITDSIGAMVTRQNAKANGLVTDPPVVR